MRVRRLLIALAGLTGLGALAAVVFVASFDANRYKPELIELLRQRTGRTLSVDGELSIALLPRVGLSVGPARLSGTDGREEFAQFDAARIGVALWPLLARRLVVERITLDGLKLEGVRRRDGSTNFDDLLRAGVGAAPGSTPAPDAAAAAITVASLQLRTATIGWRDEAAGTEWRLQQADLEAGRIASGKPGSVRLSGRLIAKRPLVDVAIELSTDYTIDFATLATRLTDFDLKVRGRVPAAPGLDARLRGSLSADPVTAGIDLADLKLVARSGDGVEATLDAPALAIAADRAGGKPIRGRVRVDGDAHRIDATLSIAAPTRTQDRIVFGDVKADATLAGERLPAGGVKVSLAGDASVDPQRATARLALAGHLDGAALQAKLSTSGFAPLALRYELQAERIDLDRLRAAPAATESPDPQAAVIAMPALAELDADGSLRIGALKVAGVDASNVAATIRSGAGRIALTRLTAGVFRGALDASAMLGDSGQHALRMRLTGVDAGMALRALAGRDALEGRGDLSLNVTGGGQTLAALERSLDGTAAIALRDGALRGVDLAALLRRVRQAIATARGTDSPIEQTPSGGDRTAFSSLDASFLIRDGIARNDDLDLRSPLLRVSGAGQIDLPRRHLDYLARVSVVGTLSGQGGAELAALRGVSVPVQLSGPFATLSYRVDVAALVVDNARQALTRRLQEKLLGKPAAGAKEPSKSISPRDLLEEVLRR